MTYLVTVRNTDGSTRIVKRLANSAEAAMQATGHNKGDKVISAVPAVNHDNLLVPAAWVTKRPNAPKAAKAVKVSNWSK